MDLAVFNNNIQNYIYLANTGNFEEEDPIYEHLQTDSYMLSDIGLKVQRRSHEFSIHIDNLLDTEYIPHLSLLKESGIYEPGRNFVFKYSVKF